MAIDHDAVVTGKAGRPGQRIVRNRAGPDDDRVGFERFPRTGFDSQASIRSAMQRGCHRGKPYIDTVVAVCGKVPRPSVVYVLTAKNIDYEWESLKQDFLPLILASVKKAPF